MVTDQSIVQTEKGDALIVIDVQKDFLPGGALAVPEGDQVIPVLNWYLEAFAERGLPTFATRDWHPANHCSFVAQGGRWPVHCVANTSGAAFAPGLNLPPSAVVISKETEPGEEHYSNFQGTGLEQKLREAAVGRLFVGGLATDYCVLNTVRDALDRGFQVMLLRDAIRAVNVHPDDGRQAEEEMIRGGAIPFQLEELVT